MQDQILSEHKFRTRFAHGCRYGTQDAWPKETILFYRLIGEDKPTSWKMISSYSTTPLHVEITMMNDEDLIPTTLQHSTYTLEMIISFSPCKKCSDELIRFKNTFKSMKKTLRVTIRISSFYQVFNPRITYNMDGLLNLLKENVVLKVFDGDSDWTEFLRDVINLPEEHFVDWLAVTWEPVRKEREYVDRCILKDIYSCYHGTINKHDLYEMGTAVHPLQVREIYKKRKVQYYFFWGPYWQTGKPWSRTNYQ